VEDDDRQAAADQHPGSRRKSSCENDFALVGRQSKLNRFVPSVRNLPQHLINGPSVIGLRFSFGHCGDFRNLRSGQLAAHRPLECCAGEGVISQAGRCRIVCGVRAGLYN
jgi:hypothetical protein